MRLFKPQSGSGGSNSIIWDADEGAYKFSFVANDGDERGFGIDSEIFHKLARETGASCLRFKLKAGSPSIKNVIFGYIPDWWQKEGERTEEISADAYFECSFDFLKLPKRDNGKLKEPFVLAYADKGVSSYLYIKDIEITRPYDVAEEIDANMLVVDNFSVNNSKLFYETVSSGYPAGGENVVLKSFTSTEKWKTVWNGNDI